MRTLCDVCEAAPARLFCAADEAALCPDCDDKVHGCNKLASRHVRVELAEARAVPRCDICENAPGIYILTLMIADDSFCKSLKRLQLNACKGDVFQQLKSPAFFYCGIDGTSLCLQCDMDVHIDGKKTHERYLLMGQRVKLPSQNGLLAAEVAVARPAEGHREAAARQQGNGHHLYHHHQHRSQEKISSDWNNSNSPAVAITVGDEGEKVYADVQIGWMIDLNSKPQHLQSQSHVMKNGESSDPMSSDDECVGVVPQLTAREVMEASSA